MTTGERRDLRHVARTGPSSSPLSRRATLGVLAALGATTVAGCTPARQGGAQAETPAATPTPTGSGATSGSAASPTSPRRLDPDVALAAVVLREEQAMLDRVLATAGAHPRLAGDLRGARTAHRAHVALLTRAVPPEQLPSATGGAARRVPRRARDALTAVARAEATLADSGRRHAMTARSGAFARVLASTSAAALQLSVQLADVPGPRR